MSTATRTAIDDLQSTLSLFWASGDMLARALERSPAVARPVKLAAHFYQERIFARHLSIENSRLLNENFRLIQTSEKEALEFVKGLRFFPHVTGAAGEVCARILEIARDYLDLTGDRFSEESCAAFLDGFQDLTVLNMAEIWALRPALQQEILERLSAADEARWPDLLLSLRLICDFSWKELFETVNVVDRILRNDPAGAYSRMDFQSREQYRQAITAVAKGSAATEQDIAKVALEMAEEAHQVSNGSRAAIRRMHIGYYLVDDGLSELEYTVQFRPPLRDRIRRAALRWPTAFYLGGIEICTFLIVVFMLAGLDSLTPILAGLLLLILPATQAAVSFVNGLVTFLTPPRALPRLEFPDGVPPECATIVAVPTLLLNEGQVRDLVLDLEIRFLGNRDPRIHFALLTDCPDADQPLDDSDRLAALCAELIEGLNRRYPERAFLMLHRQRVYNPSEGRWMGWERKRGKLLEFNRLLRGGVDSFPFKAGEISILPQVRYVIALDCDTQLPRDAAARLIGTIAHPLNAAVVDPVRKIVVEGYGILQPRIGISIHSAARSRLASLYSGETGFDIYTRAVSDVYQDLFREGIFTGKGIYDVDALREVLEDRFPENELLSHDLLEGAYARAALVSDIELIDDYPSHFSAYCRRKHRWVRGDWQTLRWLRESVPGRGREPEPNPTSVISRWKIVDNLRRSLLEPSLVVLLAGGWFALPGRAAYWTVAAAAMPFIAAYWALLFSLLRAPRNGRGFEAWAHQTLRTFADATITAFFTLVFLLHQALLSIDAIVRSILRMFVTGRSLLEWETAAEANATRKATAAVDVYLKWTPIISVAIGLLLWRVRPHALYCAAPILTLWAGSTALSSWLNRRPRVSNRTLRQRDVEWLRAHSEKMCRFFRDWSTPATNWLIPDHVREDGEAAMVISPTNLGMLLNARIAALHLGALTRAQFIFQTQETLARVMALEKFNGHLLNWYDILTLQPLGPRFVSTVDSGNLAASLWTLKQAALEMADSAETEGVSASEITSELRSIAIICDALVRDMDFKFLYEPRRKVLSVGYDVEAARVTASYYDLLASEARTATFIAIAKGDIPQKAWFHLGRAHTLFGGQRILVSWTGTIFEYLMPVIWMRHYPGTILQNSAQAVIKAQREYGRRKGVAWGFSESSYVSGDGSYGYGPFGIPALGLKRQGETEFLVVSPYSAFLAAAVDPAPSFKNLRNMEEYGWTGRYGFYEAIDYSRSGATPVRSWMAHHQGMSLLAVCNLLFDQPFQRYFHADPNVQATELLLHERLPAGLEIEELSIELGGVAKSA